MRNLAQKNLADEVRSWIEETGMTKRICHMQILLAKSSIHIDLKHTICRAYRKRNLVTQLGGHYILLSEWAPQKTPHLPPENLDTSFSLFHASREKLTYSPAKAIAQENKTPRDRQKKRQKLGERFCFCFWDLRRPSAAARRNSSTGAGLRGSTSKSTRHCTPLSFQFLLLLWLIPWVVFDSSASKPNTLYLCEITESPLCSYTPTVHEACVTLIRWYSWCPWTTAFFPWNVIEIRKRCILH